MFGKNRRVEANSGRVESPRLLPARVTGEAPGPYQASPNLNALENCPNNAFRGIPTKGGLVEVICPKYPFGSGDVVSGVKAVLERDKTRDEIAKVLGCASCAFREQPMERVDFQRMLPDGAIETEIKFIPTSPTPDSVSQ